MEGNFDSPFQFQNLKISDNESYVGDPKILKVLSYYRIKREDA